MESVKRPIVITAVAILNIIIALVILIGLYSYIAEPSNIQFFGGVIAMLVLPLGVCIGLALIFLGYGLIKGKESARIGSIVLGALAMLIFIANLFTIQDNDFSGLIFYFVISLIYIITMFYFIFNNRALEYFRN